MGHPAGVKVDRVKLERRRMRAPRLLRRGLSEAEVARQVGAHRQSVNRWARQLASGGRKGLTRTPRTGRRSGAGPICGASHGARSAAPEALGYRTGLWRAWRVADLIGRECGVAYSTVHAWRILRALGSSPQRPTSGAVERNEAAIDHWKRVRWPQLKKTPKGGATRFSLSTKAG